MSKKNCTLYIEIDKVHRLIWVNQGPTVDGGVYGFTSKLKFVWKKTNTIEEISDCLLDRMGESLCSTSRQAHDVTDCSISAFHRHTPTVAKHDDPTTISI